MDSDLMNKAQTLVLRSALLTAAVLPVACTKPAPQAPAAPQSAGSAPAGNPSGKPSGWDDKPVDGSPGVNPPPLSGKNLILKENFADGKSLPWTTSFSTPGDGEAT